MSNWMKSARSWLGLGEDPYYEDDYGDEDDYREDHRDDRGDRVERRGRAHGFDEPEEDDDLRPARAVRPTRGSTVAPLGAPAPARDWDDADGGVRVISGATAAADPEPRGVVRPLPSATKPEVFSPGSFNDAQEVADAFKRSVPVIMNLQGGDRDLTRRLIDFASGLCYGLSGEMERVADNVFLLTPDGAQVSEDDRRAIRDGSLLAEDK